MDTLVTLPKNVHATLPIINNLFRMNNGDQHFVLQLFCNASCGHIGVLYVRMKWNCYNTNWCYVVKQGEDAFSNWCINIWTCVILRCLPYKVICSCLLNNASTKETFLHEYLVNLENLEKCSIVHERRYLQHFQPHNNVLSVYNGLNRYWLMQCQQLLL